MQIEVQVVNTITLTHWHVAEYLKETSPLDRAILVRKALQAFEPAALNTLIAYLREHLGGDVEDKAAILAVCAFAEQLNKAKEQT